MSAAPAHKLILASAGTGKTYQLSGRFLALLLGGVPPERILATTFTRKAAGEILDRVLLRLVEAAEDPRKLAELNEQLAEEGRPPVTRAAAVNLLSELARGLNRFRIRTLDAFFVQLAGVFALELGLPPEWRILDDDERKTLERESISDALSCAERPELLELLRALQKSDATRSVERTLLRVADEGRAAYLDSRRPAWDRVNVPDGLEEERLAEVLAQLEAMPLACKKGTFDEYDIWIKARAELLALARRGAWETALSKGFLKNLAAGKKKYDRGEFTPEHLAVLEPLLEQAAHAMLTAVRRQNHASFDWLERFERSLAARKDRVSGLSFEDVPRALAGDDPAALGATFDLGYRLDGRIDHLLLDEFQDTAPAQWRVLAPLAEEIVATGGGEKSFFCVGDVKQSIYAWRSGEPRLLSGMPERWPALPPPRELSLNWRSSPVVLDAVDRVFRDIAASPAFERKDQEEQKRKGDTPGRRAARLWQTGYAAQQAARPLPGAVLMHEARPASEGESRELPPLELAAERAAALAVEAPHATIAVLLRRNNHVARMIDLLRRQGLRASGEGGNPLIDSAAVLHALSALHLADHPGDSAAAFHVATSPLAAALEVSEDDVPRPSAASRRLRARLARLGQGELLGELLPLVERSPDYGPWDAKRFGQLVDLGYSFDRRAELRTTAFLDYVRDTKVEDPSSTQVKVMTIHASKGLEFDAVLLPELDLSMTLREMSVLRGRPLPEELLAGVSVSRKHDVCDLDPEGLGALRLEEDVRHIQEALCLLYVAMTRAARRLELFVRAPKQGMRTLSYATVLKHALAGTARDEPLLPYVHAGSADAWWPEPRSGAPRPAVPEPRLPRFAPPPAPRELPRRSPSAEEGGHALDAHDLLRPRRGHGFARGTLVHRLLEQVEWLEGFDRSDAELDALLAPLERDPAARAEALAAFRAALASPEVSALLRRPPGETEVWRERAFAEIVREGEGEVLWTGTFDRAVLHRAQGRVVRAEVIDFKTDRVDAAGVPARAAFYAPQLAGYRRVLARMTELAPDRVGGALAFLDPGVVLAQ